MTLENKGYMKHRRPRADQRGRKYFGLSLRHFST